MKAKKPKPERAGTELSPWAKKVYEHTVRLIALRQATEEADAELGLMLGGMAPEAAGLTALVLIARAAGRSWEHGQSPIADVTPHSQRPVAYTARAGKPTEGVYSRETYDGPPPSRHALFEKGLDKDVGGVR